MGKCNKTAKSKKVANATQKDNAESIAKKRKTDTNRKAPDDAILQLMMECHIYCDDSITFSRIWKHFKVDVNNQEWRTTWKELREQGYIEPSTADGQGDLYEIGHKLAEKGIACTANEKYDAFKELKETIASPPGTNEEYHELIRKNLRNNDGVQIFDLLLKHGELFREELGSLSGTNHKYAAFSYSLKQLKSVGLVEKAPESRKKRLSDKAFVEERPKTIQLNQDMREELINAKGKAKKKAKQAKKGTVDSGATEKMASVKDEVTDMAEKEKKKNNKQKKKRTKATADDEEAVETNTQAAGMEMEEMDQTTEDEVGDKNIELTKN